MKIWLFSDLHLPHGGASFEQVFSRVPDADVCVCAGDLIEGDPVAGVHWLARYVRPTMPVVYVMGNHEFYNLESSMERARQQARLAADQAGIDLLDDTTVTINGVQFLGATLWSDFDIFARGNPSERDRAMTETGRWMNDFHLIRARESSPTIWTPKMAMTQHFQSRLWLERTLGKSAVTNVVVSHHAPHPNSIAPQFARSLLTGGFVSDLTELILLHQPKLWLHGHTHTDFNYKVGETGVRCNPRGYRHETMAGYDPCLTIEV